MRVDGHEYPAKIVSDAYRFRILAALFAAWPLGLNGQALLDALRDWPSPYSTHSVNPLQLATEVRALEGLRMVRVERAAADFTAYFRLPAREALR